MSEDSKDVAPAGGRSRVGRHSRARDADNRPGKPAGWLITYSDMITLLMAFFIGMIAFYARSPAGSVKEAGSAGEASRDAARQSRSFDSSTTVWRLRNTPAHRKEAFLYQDPPGERAEDILHNLHALASESLTGGHAVRLPLTLLFDEDNRLSASGRHLLSAIATGVRSLPCQLHFHCEKSSSLARAVDVCSYLILREGFLPARLAVGGHPPAEAAGEAIWLVLVRPF